MHRMPTKPPRSEQARAPENQIPLRGILDRRRTPRFQQLATLCVLFALSACTLLPQSVNDAQEPLDKTPTNNALLLPSEWTPAPSTMHEGNPSIFEDHPELSTHPLSNLTLDEAKQPKIIGYSVEGRPLEVYIFGDGPRNHMIVAGIHGGYEWNTIALAEELIDFLSSNPSWIPPQLTLHILRAFNPDGAARSLGVMGRGNAHGVDLNRNWNSSWQSKLDLVNCWNLVPLTGGPNPGSEPETRALMYYLITANIKALISYHSAGLGIFPGGEPATEKSLSLAEAISEVSDYPYPHIDIGCDYTGTLPDWAVEVDIAALDVELSNHWETDFEQNLRILTAFLEWRP